MIFLPSLWQALPLELMVFYWVAPSWQKIATGFMLAIFRQLCAMNLQKLPWTWQNAVYNNLYGKLGRNSNIPSTLLIRYHIPLQAALSSQVNDDVVVFWFTLSLLSLPERPERPEREREEYGVVTYVVLYFLVSLNALIISRLMAVIFFNNM